MSDAHEPSIGRSVRTGAGTWGRLARRAEAMTRGRILRERISRAELARRAEDRFGDWIKAVVDVSRGIMAIGGDLHADDEAALLADGSRQRDLWGINLYPGESGGDWIEFDSMINLRPTSLWSVKPRPPAPCVSASGRPWNGRNRPGRYARSSEACSPREHIPQVLDPEAQRRIEAEGVKVELYLCHVHDPRLLQLGRTVRGRAPPRLRQRELESKRDNRVRETVVPRGRR